VDVHVFNFVDIHAVS